MLCDWGYRGILPPGKGIPARVVSAHGGYYRIVCDEGEGLARKKASVYHDHPEALVPVTGDFVRLEWNPAGESRIVETLPRMSYLERLDPSSKGYGTQTIAVNFDTLFFLMSANENFSLSRVARFLALARDSECLDRVVILLTKCDLLAGPDEVEAWCVRLREGLGEVPVLALSVKTGLGLDRVAAYVRKGETLAFTGSSGVGKSTLVNALMGEQVMDTCEIQEWSGKGRHTTTVRELVLLPSGALALDTPGMRELGLVGEDRTRFFRSGTHRFR